MQDPGLGQDQIAARHLEILQADESPLGVGKAGFHGFLRDEIVVGHAVERATAFDEIVHDFGEAYWEKTGIEYSSDLTLYRPVGCDQCSNTGYRGRLGIHELMEGTKEIKALIKKAEETEKLFATAIEQGMNTLKQDGILKSFQGLTDVSEIRRICIA